jgi:sulfur relay (sulfurtransferase) complex TusBCD TusD component (DsrE family)
MNILVLINDAPYGTEISNLTELAQWAVDADKVFTF